MPLPDLSTFCVALAPGNRPAIVLPGGVTLSAPSPSATIPGPDEMTNALLASANAALAPLAPIFDMLDVLVALVNCVKAVEQCLGPPPDPSKLVQCFPKLEQALAKLLQIVPQLTVPVMIGGLLDVIVANLSGLRNQLIAVISKQLAIAGAQTRAKQLGSAALQTAVDCATQDLAAAMLNLNQNSAPLGRLINTLNAFLDLVGLPEIPAIGTLGSDAQAALAPLDDVIQTLTVIRKTFP
jgi:hypothetical protein